MAGTFLLGMESVFQSVHLERTEAHHFDDYDDSHIVIFNRSIFILIYQR